MAPAQAFEVPFDVGVLKDRVFTLRDLSAFDFISVPVWINDVSQFRLVWGNVAACRLWKVDRMPDVDLSDASPQTRAYAMGQLESWLSGATRVMPYVQRTLYPRGEAAISGQMSHAPIRIQFPLEGEASDSASGEGDGTRTCLLISFSVQSGDATHDARARECFRLCESRFWMYEIPSPLPTRPPLAEGSAVPLQQSAVEEASLGAKQVMANETGTRYSTDLGWGASIPFAAHFGYDRISSVWEVLDGATSSNFGTTLYERQTVVEDTLTVEQRERVSDPKVAALLGCYRMRVIKMRDPATGKASVVVYHEDITELKQTEHKLETALMESASKSDFISKMSHEIRTPMNAVLGCLQYLDVSGQGLSADQRECVLTALMSGRALLSTLTDILDMRKLEAGTLSIKRAGVSARDVVTVVQDIIRMFDATKVSASVVGREGATGLLSSLPYRRSDGAFAPRAELSMDVDLSALGIVGDSGGVTLHVDLNRLRQCVMNLVSNAVKYTPEGWVSVGVRLDGDMLVVSVHDTGVGIPSELHAKIFEPLFRVEGSQDAAGAVSAGLGLAITRHLVELMSGTIHVDSTVGEGSTFTLFVRCSSDPDGSTRPVGKVRSRTHASGLLRTHSASGSRPLSMESGASASPETARRVEDSARGLAMRYTMPLAMRVLVLAGARVVGDLVVSYLRRAVACVDVVRACEPDTAPCAVCRCVVEEHERAVDDRERAEGVSDRYDLVIVDESWPCLVCQRAEGDDVLATGTQLKRQCASLAAYVAGTVVALVSLDHSGWMKGASQTPNVWSLRKPLLPLELPPLLKGVTDAYADGFEVGGASSAKRRRSSGSSRPPSKTDVFGGTPERRLSAGSVDLEEPFLRQRSHSGGRTVEGVRSPLIPPASPFKYDGAQRAGLESDVSPHTTHDSVAEAAETPPPTSWRILLAEDNRINQMIFVRIMRIVAPNIAVDIASDGQAALDLFVKSHKQGIQYIAILLDVQMPVMDGIRASAAIRETERALSLPRTPLYIVSADNVSDFTGRSVTDIDGRLSKPVSVDEFRQLFASLLPSDGKRRDGATA